MFRLHSSIEQGTRVVTRDHITTVRGYKDFVSSCCVNEIKVDHLVMMSFKGVWYSSDVTREALSSNSSPYDIAVVKTTGHMHLCISDGFHSVYIKGSKLLSDVVKPH